ncbi:mediator of RNA polymerase II transcription subunit 13 [Apophysomyces sp. BC1034]|nr:mediator of RNA polymerase II transcription subunit 13 [Apophysomyces sp. BC1015]KAG0183159.1 mediator of RNA polymerase II transcription subunit 13 [Apophysomyces sp. BC1021]KAG0189680.1 mediator of RNA polymerase II transcription subunit 13 [Apophysomyces sp. BC1034]
MWRVSPDNGNDPADLRSLNGSKDEETVLLELWVFWFDDRHTKEVDKNQYLGLLEEINMGSFTWDNVSSKSLSPTASPVSQAHSSSNALVAVADEYKLFINSIRNLVQRFMTRNGVMPLGDFFIIPSMHDSRCATSNNDNSEVGSLLTCTYNIYLSSTNLIFQPNTRRMKIKPLSADEAKVKGTRGKYHDLFTGFKYLMLVILSPSGEYAHVAASRAKISRQIESHVLMQWSLLFDIPYSELEQTQKQLSLSPLTPIWTTRNDFVFYPTALIFVPTSSVPAASTNGAATFKDEDTNAEDVNQKWIQWTWAESLASTRTPQGKANGTQIQPVKVVDHPDYWEYTNPRGRAAFTVLEATSTTDGLRAQSMLQKALGEPITSSPLMATKSVTKPTISHRNDTPNLSDMGSTDIDRSGASLTESRCSVLDFAMAHFSLDPTTSLIALGFSAGTAENAPEPIQNTEAVVNCLPETIDTDVTMQQPVTDNIPDLNQPIPQPELNGLNQANGLNVEFGMEGLEDMYDISNRWDDPMGDLDNLDFDVTEEDFDFFASAPANDIGGETVPQTEFSSNQEIAQQELMLLDNMALHDVGAVSGSSESKEEIDLSALLNGTGNLLHTPMVMVDSPKCVPDDEEKLLLNDLEAADHGMNGTCHSAASIFRSLEQDEEPAVITSVEEETSPSVMEYKGECRFVPPEFAPVTFVARVNDAKYCDGGKFTYTPPNKSKKSSRKLHREIYRPDYVPTVKKQQGKPKPGRFVSSKQSDLNSLSTEISSSSSDYCSSSDDNEDNPMESHGSTSSEGADQWLDSLKTAQAGFVSLLLGNDTPKDLPDISSWNLKLDSSFSNTSHSPSANTKLPPQDEDDLKALDYLCQQAVMGGYPFLGGLTVMSTNDGEVIEGESAETMIKRRRDLIQRFHGDTMHAPSLTSDFEGITQQFKTMLTDIFSRDTGASLEHMRMEYPPALSTVSVKGPLNVQQYYDLSETNQAHSKYGKYQVKKRRQAEPNLDTLYPPDVVVSRQEDLVEGSPKLITFWEKLRLEPYSPKKNVHYFAVFPSNTELENVTSQFLTGLSTVYETCLLGNHYPGNAGSYHRGLVPVPLLPESSGESWNDRQFRSYMAECQNLGSALGSTVVENMHIVVYLVNPSSHYSSNLDLSRCFRKLMIAYEAAAMGLATQTTEDSRARVVMQLVPIEHILQPTAFGGYLKFGLKEIAFSVYSKCHTVVPRDNCQMGADDYRSTTEVYAPAFVLTKTAPETLTFALKNVSSAFPVILNQQEALHVGYCFSLDQRWMIVVWTDNRGELVDYSVLDVKNHSDPSLRDIFDEIWWRTKEIAQRTAFPWTFVIAKLGLMFENELQAWLNTISGEDKVAIVSVDIESALHVYPMSEQETAEFPHTPGSASNTPTPESVNTPTASPMLANARSSDTSANGDTRILLLNHRVAYSQRRERAARGIIAVDTMKATESWILPLASGYLIHTPSTSELSFGESVGDRPLVFEGLFQNTKHKCHVAMENLNENRH